MFVCMHVWINEKVILGNIYFPTRDKERMQCDFLLELDRLISSIVDPVYSLLIGGD